MRRRDDGVNTNTTVSSNTKPLHQGRSHSTHCRDQHGVGGVPCSTCQDTNSVAAAAADGATGVPASWRRRHLAASALALCTVAFLLQDTLTLGRAALRHAHARGPPAIPAADSGGSKAPAGAPAAGVPAAGALVAGTPAAATAAEIDLDLLTYRLDDGGPGSPWVPPAERPIPLDAFPVFNGHGFKANGNLDIVDRELASATGAGATNMSNAYSSSSSSNSSSGGAATEVNKEGEVRTAARGAGATSTLLFMHVWKCAGSSLRHLLRDWASLKGQDIGIVVKCADIVSQKEDKICMQRHALVNETVQAPFVRLKQVVAGHFTWGFQKHVTQPYVMFTTLRNPLELFVSGQQYLNRKASKHFAHAVSLVEETMATAITTHELRGGLMLPEGAGNAKSVGFIHRLVDPVIPGLSDEGDVAQRTLDTAAREAKDNLDTFWLVGVIEQYKGFIAVLKHMMDPLKSERDLWKRYAVGKYNTSPQGAGKVLAAVDPALVQEFNDTLAHQWDVYSYAVELYKHRCKQMLHTRDLELCEVPLAPSQYTLTDLERQELDLERAELQMQQRDGDAVLTDLEREELQMQREELRRQREELQIQREELQIQREEVPTQRHGDALAGLEGEESAQEV